MNRAEVIFAAIDVLFHIPQNYIRYKDIECEKDIVYSDADIDRLWSEREASEETLRLLDENQLPNLARIFTERRYVKNDNIHFSRKYFEEMKKQGFFNQ